MVLQGIKNWVKTRNFLNDYIKKYCYLKYAKKYLKKQFHVPKAIFLETTNFCNAKCRMCPHIKIKREKGYMDWDLFKKVIDEAKSFEGEGLNIYLHKDGEPLLDALLFKRIKYIKQQLSKSKVYFHSNAMLLDEEKAKQLLDSGIDGVSFSVDGASEEGYEKIRAGLKYDIVKNNLEHFFEMRRRHTDRIEVTMQMVVCAENKQDINKYRRLWLDKADIVYFKARHSFLDTGPSLKTNTLKNRQLAFCEQPYDDMFIYWNGDVGLCCWDYDNLANLGNIREGELLSVYNNDRFNMIRAAMNNMDCSLITPCNVCAAIYGSDRSRYFGWEKRFRRR